MRGYIMKSKVCGVGINDADYVVNKTSNGIKYRCPYYRTWERMLNRCYSSAYQLTRSTYVGCYVCDEWLTFSSFKAWMQTQDFDGKQLDKDIIKPGNKEYCPSACAFVDSTVNGLLKESGKIRGKYPIGVNEHKKNGRLEAKISIEGKQVRLGFFDSPEDAHSAWKKAKINRILEVASTQSDERIVSGLHTHAKLIGG